MTSVWLLAAEKADPPKVEDPWDHLARPEQKPPPGDWLVWLLITGRRWGKTRSAAEWLRRRALDEVGSYAICAPTYADVRDVCVEGGTPGTPSGFLSICQPGEVANYNRSLGELRMTNGSKIKMLSADEPDRARGWGFHAAWCDELSSWRYPATWYETLLPAVSMADRHRFVVTTTPKPNLLTRALIAQAHDNPDEVRIVRGRTTDNAANLGAGVFEQLRRQMTERQARQELYGELLDDVEGALWTLAGIDEHRLADPKALIGFGGGLTRIIVGVDPAGTAHAGSDETGIVVVGKGSDGRGYVLADVSCVESPDGWGRKAVWAYHEHQADRIVAEVNNGWDMVRHVLHTVDANVPVTEVRAKKSKYLRAEPIAALYEQGRVSHVGVFEDLESQMCEWAPDSGDSPDRIDALVYALTELFPPTQAVTATAYTDQRHTGRRAR